MALSKFLLYYVEIFNKFKIQIKCKEHPYDLISKAHIVIRCSLEFWCQEENTTTQIPVFHICSTGAYMQIWLINFECRS